MEWLILYLFVGLALFALGLSRADETAWLGFRALPEVFLFQLLTFILVWPLLLAADLHQR